MSQSVSSSGNPYVPGSPRVEQQRRTGLGLFQQNYTSHLRESRGIRSPYVDVREVASTEQRLGSVDTLNESGNPRLTEQEFQTLVDGMKEDYPNNPFEPKLSETGQIVWLSTRAVNGLEVAQVVKFTSGALGTGRKLHINTGTHGDQKGDTVTQDTSYGESKFSQVDLKTVWDLSNVSIHIVSKNAPAFHPENIDSIDAWCYSQASQHQLKKDPKDIGSFFTKIYQSLCRDSEPKSAQPPPAQAQQEITVSASGPNSQVVGSVSRDSIGVSYGDAAQSVFNAPVAFGGQLKKNP
ncbi:MAG: hypothetical protein V4591_07720 [Bdellovibrionota bacterium]